MNVVKNIIIYIPLILWSATIIDCDAQSLAGTDDLGRVLPLYEQTGPIKKNRHAALFYFLWQGHETSEKYWDLSKIVGSHPEVLNDFENHYWGGDGNYDTQKPVYGYYYWGEPIYGYYSADDYWVQLRNVQLLTDAAVDILIIDATNTLTYPHSADVLMRAMDAVRKQGKTPPKIVFYTNTASGKTMQKAYNDFYKPDAPYRHPDCWFYLDGKPLILGISQASAGRDYENFFTYRESQWPNEPQKVNGWPWLEFIRPQRVYFNSKGKKEIVNVSVAQHPNPEAGMGGSAFYGNTDNWGRSYHKGRPGDPKVDLPFGYNVQEQWNFALTQHTPFIFITGWNEWIAGRFKSHDSNPEHSWFCDEASPEYSRDIEPTLTAGLKDNYYMQMVSNIRRYKGTAANAVPGNYQVIHDLSDWQKVGLIYRDYTGDTQPRHHLGAQSSPRTFYTNRTGRNDFDVLKLARDGKNIYFYARTVSSITPDTDDSWMRLYIDYDRSWKTGWKGYDYRIVQGGQLQQYQDAGWVDVQHLRYQVAGNQMMITVPRKYLMPRSKVVNLEFKWSDNMQHEDPLDWYVNGDAAPGGRFNFVFSEKED